jgi:adenylyl cyclase-associated protein
MGSLGSAAPEAPKAEPKKEEAKAPVKAAPAKPAKPAPKPPVKVLRFKTWEISNYGAETLHFPAAEVNPGMTFNFFNCEKTKVVIEGKFKNAMLSRCKKIEIKMDECLSMMEILKSENVKVTVGKKCPMVSVELSNGVQIYTTAESKTSCQLSTTASQSVSFIYPKNEGTFDPNDEEDDDVKTDVIPETYVSKLDANDHLTVTPQLGID